MIIGNVSIDPRRVLHANLRRGLFAHRLYIYCLYGSSVIPCIAKYTRYTDASIDLSLLDSVCHQGQLVDLVSSTMLEDDEDDEEEGRMGFI